MDRNSQGFESYFKDGKVSTFTKKNGLPSDVVFASYADRDGSVWLGTREGLVRWKSGEFKTYTTKDGLSSNVVQVIYEGRNHALSVGTGGGGLDRYKDGKFEVFDSRRGLSNDVVLSVYEASDGVLWVGSDGGGLNRLKDGKFTAYMAKDGMLDDAVFQILPDGAGNLWMSSNRGIFRASIQDLNEFAEKKIRRVPVVSYGTADGMNTSECNGGFQPAGWKTRDGRLWFSTMKGLVAIDPQKARGNDPSFPAIIEQVIINGREINKTENIQIPPGKGELEFYYSAPDFRSPQRIAFKYRLQGFDQDWVKAEGWRIAYYTNIPWAITFTRVGRQRRWQPGFERCLRRLTVASALLPNSLVLLPVCVRSRQFNSGAASDTHAWNEGQGKTPGITGGTAYG